MPIKEKTIFYKQNLWWIFLVFVSPLFFFFWFWYAIDSWYIYIHPICATLLQFVNRERNMIPLSKVETTNTINRMVVGRFFLFFLLNVREQNSLAMPVHIIGLSFMKIYGIQNFTNLVKKVMKKNTRIIINMINVKL